MEASEIPLDAMPAPVREMPALTQLLKEIGGGAKGEEKDLFVGQPDC